MASTGHEIHWPASLEAIWINVMKLRSTMFYFNLMYQSCICFHKGPNNINKKAITRTKGKLVILIEITNILPTDLL